MSSELHKSIDQSIHTPIARKYFEEFTRLGIDQDTDSILEQLPADERAPIEWALRTHIYKEKAIFPAYIADSRYVDPSITNPVAAACDVLWGVSLVYDDLFDSDEQRAGKPTSWVKYGKESAMKAAQTGMEATLRYLAKKVGATTSDIFAFYIQQGVKSLDKERQLRLSTPIQDILQVYEERCNFYQAAPADALLDLGIIDQNEHDSVVTGFHNFTHAAQITNDLTDCSIKPFGRPSFSDVRNGVVSVPIATTWRVLDESERPFFSNLFGNGEISDADQQRLNDLFARHKAIEVSTQLINSGYDMFLKSFSGIVKPEYVPNLEEWVKHKKQGIPNP